MDTRITAISTELQALIGMVQYYRGMCPRQSHVLDCLINSSSVPNGRNMEWNKSLESYFKELKRMVSAETLISYPDWKLTFTVHNDTSDKQSGAVISQNDKLLPSSQEY